MTHRTIKWIIADDKIRIGTVEYHKFLIADKERPLIEGGGMLLIDRDGENLVFYGSSFDFGRANEEQFKKILDRDWEDGLKSEIEMTANSAYGDFETDFDFSNYKIKIMLDI